MDDNGARLLITAILQQAHEDYNNSCPNYCPYIDSCDRKKGDCRAREFIHSDWCGAMCEGIDILHDLYVETTIKKARWSKDAFRYVEKQIRHFHENKEKLKLLEDEIIFGETRDGAGRSSGLSDKTGSRGIKLASDSEIRFLRRSTGAVQDVYDHSANIKKEVIKLKYWDNKFRDEGIAHHLGISIATLYRWRNEFIVKTGIRLKAF